MTTKKAVIGLVILSAALFLGWRFVRPMNIFSVTKNFERPISTAKIPEPLETLSAKECAGCHREIYDEWSTTIHSKAWTDPYFRADFKFDGSPQICLNCHTPLDRQQENLVLGFRDDEKWDPILAPNPDFDHDLQQEGVTCAACHVKEGAILGPSGGDGAPPTRSRRWEIPTRFACAAMSSRASVGILFSSFRRAERWLKSGPRKRPPPVQRGKS